MKLTKLKANLPFPCQKGKKTISSDWKLRFQCCADRVGIRALIVQWIEQLPSKEWIEVRLLVRAI